MTMANRHNPNLLASTMKILAGDVNIKTCLYFLTPLDWADDEPTNLEGQESCLLVNDTGEWLDEACTTQQLLIAPCIKQKLSIPGKNCVLHA